MQVIRSLALLALVSCAALLLSGYADGEGEGACSTALTEPSLELVYRLEAGEKAVTPRTREEAMAIVCERLQALGGTEGEVRSLAGGRIQVLLSQVGGGDELRRVTDQVGATGQVYFYDWEPNLIGPERLLGGHPGAPPPVHAKRRAEREWYAAGRNPDRPANAGLIFAGAFPNVYGAVKLASEEEPRETCAMCSASSPRFYMFDRSPAHELIAGPVTTRSTLRTDTLGRHRRRGVVLKVPVGTAIASERPTSPAGAPITAGGPGWFALKDRFALSGNEITDPRQEINELGAPNVTFGFTGKGRVAFQELTREVAYRGRARAIGRVGSKRAAELSGHLALVFDGEIMTRPIIDFTQNPDGIDGRTGAQISGGFSSAQEARDLATILSIGALPIDLALIRRAVH